MVPILNSIFALKLGVRVSHCTGGAMASRSRSFVSRKCHPNRPATVSEAKWEHFINTRFAPLLVPTIPYVSIYISRADEGGIGQ